MVGKSFMFLHDNYTDIIKAHLFAFEIVSSAYTLLPPKALDMGSNKT